MINRAGKNTNVKVVNLKVHFHNIIWRFLFCWKLGQTGYYKYNLISLEMYWFKFILKKFYKEKKLLLYYKKKFSFLDTKENHEVMHSSTSILFILVRTAKTEPSITTTEPSSTTTELSITTTESTEIKSVVNVIYLMTYNIWQECSLKVFF